MKINFDTIIENESERKFYITLHKKIKEFTKNNPGISFWDIVRYVGGSDRRILRLLYQMVETNELKLESKKVYPIQGKGNQITKPSICSECDGKIVAINGKWKKIKEIMDSIYKRKPLPTFLFDQRPVNSETTVRRVEYLLQRGDLVDKEIAIIGDDDLTSITIGLSGQAKKITVFDIDERLINFIKEISKEYSLPIEAYLQNLTNDFPEQFENKYDVFLTDPTPNEPCFELFISVGLRLLKRGAKNIGYVSFFPSHQEIDISFQKILTKYGLIITDMIPRFTEYDFIEFTYNEEDKKKLSLFDDGRIRLSFYENLTRFETTQDYIKHKLKKMALGKATKKVLENLEKDPAYIGGERDFVKETVKMLTGEENE